MSGTADRSVTITHRDDWVRAWPLNKPALIMLAKGVAVLLVAWSAIGMLYMVMLDDGPVGDADRSLARSLEDSRTPTLNTLSHVGSTISDTLVKVVLVVVVGGGMVIVWRRWHDGVFLALAVSLEASVFAIVSFIVDRNRPPVAQLDPPAPTGSFPSGHTAAAVAFYCGLYLIVRWHTTNRTIRAVFAVVAVAAPLIVAASRAYRGMHHPLDVVAGLLLGITALVVARSVLMAGLERIDRTSGDSFPERVRRLDLTTGGEPMTSSAFTTDETAQRSADF